MAIIKMPANQRSNLVTYHLRPRDTKFEFRIVCSSESMVAPNFDAYLTARSPYTGIEKTKIDIEPYFEIAGSLEINAKAINTMPHHINSIGIPTKAIFGMSGFFSKLIMSFSDR